MGLTEDPKEARESAVDPVTGLQEKYVVLSEEERAKGFVRPVRTRYVHCGPPPPTNLRDLTEEEHERYDKYGYVKFEAYPEGSGATGKFWTEKTLARLDAGCWQTTWMALPLAETYARQPDFYTGTYCGYCRAHYPVGEKGEFIWEGTDERVGT